MIILQPISAHNLPSKSSVSTIISQLNDDEPCLIIVVQRFVGISAPLATNLLYTCNMVWKTIKGVVRYNIDNINKDRFIKRPESYSMYIANVIEYGRCMVTGKIVMVRKRNDIAMDGIDYPSWVIAPNSVVWDTIP